jgi:hypothetical protein
MGAREREQRRSLRNRVQQFRGVDRGLSGMFGPRHGRRASGWRPRKCDTGVGDGSPHDCAAVICLPNGTAAFWYVHDAAPSAVTGLDSRCDAAEEHGSGADGGTALSVARPPDCFMPSALTKRTAAWSRGERRWAQANSRRRANSATVRGMYRRFCCMLVSPLG